MGYNFKDILLKIVTNDVLKIIYNKNSFIVKKKIIDIFMNAPSNADGEGFVYGFTKVVHNCKPIESIQSTENFVKLGRTKGTNNIHALKRIASGWDGTPLFYTKTKYNIKLERLVHLFCNYCHVLNYYNLYTSDKQIEWFNVESKCDVENIVKEINNIMELIHAEEPSVEILSNGTTPILIEPMNINIASKFDLMKLPKIGNKLADKIIEYRKLHTFKKIKDLLNVKNIGIKIFETIENLIYC
jgi:hypothetical protein